MTNAGTEGFNRIIKSVERAGCGYRNMINYQRRILNHIAVTDRKDQQHARVGPLIIEEPVNRVLQALEFRVAPTCTILSAIRVAIPVKPHSGDEMHRTLHDLSHGW